MHLPSEQVCPHAQAGEQLFSAHTPPTHAPPLHPQVPPQPSDAPQVRSTGHAGLQHFPAATCEPAGQSHVPPHPSLCPPWLKSAGQLGVQHLPMYALAPVGHQTPPHPSDIAACAPLAAQLGLQHAPA